MKPPSNSSYYIGLMTEPLMLPPNFILEENYMAPKTHPPTMTRSNNQRTCKYSTSIYYCRRFTKPLGNLPCCHQQSLLHVRGSQCMDWIYQIQQVIVDLCIDYYLWDSSGTSLMSFHANCHWNLAPPTSVWLIQLAYVNTINTSHALKTMESWLHF
jgi:hypothetical protein